MKAIGYPTMIVESGEWRVESGEWRVESRPQEGFVARRQPLACPSRILLYYLLSRNSCSIFAFGQNRGDRTPIELFAGGVSAETDVFGSLVYDDKHNP